MEFRLLGELEVEAGGRLLRIRGAKERTLLALFCLHANETLSRDVLIDRLWEVPPAGAAHALEVRIASLRKALDGVRNTIVTTPGGYLLSVDPERIDAERFEHLLQRGRQELAAGDPARSERTLSAALACWRGSALADVEFPPVALAEARRLDDLRLAATEERAAARLALGRHGEIVDELEPLVAQEPLRERLRAELMLALYRAGRQVDALAVYEEGRRMLVEGLGIEPGRELQQLQRAILRHEPTLDLPTAAGEPSAPPAPAFAAERPHPLRRLRALVSRRRERAHALETAGMRVYAASRIAPEPLRSELSRLAGAVAVAAHAAADADRLLCEVDAPRLALRLHELEETAPVVRRTAREADALARELDSAEALQVRRRRFDAETEPLAADLRALVEQVFQTRIGHTATAELVTEAHELERTVHALGCAVDEARGDLDEARRAHPA